MQILADQNWSTKGCGKDQPFTYWREAVLEAFDPLTIENQCEGPFSGQITAHTIDQISANRVLCSRHSVERTNQNIARSQQQYFYLLCPVSNSVNVKQSGREALLKHDDCALVSSHDPFKFQFVDDINTFSVQIPHLALTSRIPAICDATAINFSSQSTTGHALSVFVRSLPKNRLRSNKSDALRLSNLLLELIALSAGEIVDKKPGTITHLPRVNSMHIHQFIQTNLTDPFLSAAKTATAMRISPRSVHLALRGEPHSFMEIVKLYRITRISHGLIAGGFDGPNISSLAFEWGFSDLSTFHRAFKKINGCSPREFISKHLQSKKTFSQ